MKKLFFAAAMAVAMCSCGGNSSETKLVVGGSSQMDTLSYAVGLNFTQIFERQFGNIPFDMDVVVESVEAAGKGKSKITHDEAVSTLEEYFQNKMQPRMQAIMKKRAEQDSIRLAAGDSTRVEYPRADEAMFESEEERAELSYAIGRDLGENLRTMPYALQLKWVLKAFEDVKAGTPALDNGQSMQFLQNYFMNVVPAENQKASEEWLAKKEKQGTKTESGLIYKVIDAGDEQTKAIHDSDVVKVHYTGRLMDGTVFDTSIFANRSKAQQEALIKQQCYQASFSEYQKPFNQLTEAEQKAVRKSVEEELKSGDEPIEFPLNRVIAGWTEGMKLVGKGGKIMLWIPAELAYGQRGAGRDILPNMALEFEVELIDVTINEPELTPVPKTEGEE